MPREAQYQKNELSFHSNMCSGVSRIWVAFRGHIELKICQIQYFVHHTVLLFTSGGLRLLTVVSVLVLRIWSCLHHWVLVHGVW